MVKQVIPCFFLISAFHAIHPNGVKMPIESNATPSKKGLTVLENRATGGGLTHIRQPYWVPISVPRFMALFLTYL